jgi:transcriptional regulator
MAKKIPAGAGEWTPTLNGEDLEEFERLRAQLATQISLVRRLRTALGLSQLEVAEALGTTQSNVSKIEAKGDPTLSVLAGIVEAKGAKLRLTVETDSGDEFSFAVAS